MAENIAIAILIVLTYAWMMQSAAGRTWDYALPPQTDSNFSRLQIELQHQDPVEPAFFGDLTYLHNENPGETPIQIFTTGSQEYGDAITAGLVKVQEGNKLIAGPVSNYVLNPIPRNHRYLPFESAYFDFIVKASPPRSFSLFTAINRADGFALACGSVIIFTLWSARAILGSQIQVFPTILDFIVLAASILLMSTGMRRVVFNASKQNGR